MVNKKENLNIETHKIFTEKFDFFISHRKKETTALARYLKIILKNYYKKIKDGQSLKVFYDCDNLFFLDKLLVHLDNTDCVLVLISKTYFESFWCVLEFIYILYKQKSYYIYNLTELNIDELINNGIINLSNDDANVIANAYTNNFTNLYNYENSAKGAKGIIIEILKKVNKANIIKINIQDIQSKNYILIKNFIVFIKEELKQYKQQAYQNAGAFSQSNEEIIFLFKSLDCEKLAVAKIIKDFLLFKKSKNFIYYYWSVNEFSNKVKNIHNIKKIFYILNEELNEELNKELQTKIKTYGENFKIINILRKNKNKNIQISNLINVYFDVHFIILEYYLNQIYDSLNISNGGSKFVRGLTSLYFRDNNSNINSIKDLIEKFPGEQFKINFVTLNLNCFKDDKFLLNLLIVDVINSFIIGLIIDNNFYFPNKNDVYSKIYSLNISIENKNKIKNICSKLLYQGICVNYYDPKLKPIELKVIEHKLNILSNNLETE